MKKRFARLVATSTLLLSGLSFMTSCGGDDFNGLTITFWHTFGQTVAEGVQKYADRFAALVAEEDNEPIRILLENKSDYDTIRGTISKSLATGDNPTIAVAYPDHIADYFAAEDSAGNPGAFVVDLKPYMNDPNIGFGKEAKFGDIDDKDKVQTWEDVMEAFRNESSSYKRHPDGIYSMPFLKSTESMLYNYDLVNKAMYYYDSTLYNNKDGIISFMKSITWEQLMDFSEVIVQHKSDIVGTAQFNWPVYYDSDANMLISAMIQKAVPYSGTNPDGSGYIGFDGRDPKTARPDQKAAYQDVQTMLMQYKKWYDKGLFATKGVETKYSSSYFTQQQVVFTIGSTGGAGYSFPDGVDWDIESCKVPYRRNCDPLYVSQGPTVCLLHNTKLKQAGTDEKAVKYAWKFIKYMTNDDVNATMCVNNSEGYMPVRTSAYTRPQFTSFLEKTDNPYTKVAKTIIDDINGHYLSTDVFSGSAGLRKEMANILADVLKIETAEFPEATGALAGEIQRILDVGINNATMNIK